MRDQGTGRGIKPIHGFFASLGGCVGVGNLVAVCSAVQIGGPGALVWIWIAALLGMMIKYAEIYLGLHHRVAYSELGYQGGPMYYLYRAFPVKFIPLLFALLFAIYGTEVYMFHIVTETMVENWHLPMGWAIVGLLSLILYAVRGGIRRVGKICTVLLPVFISLFFLMAAYVLIINASQFVTGLKLVLTSAWSGHAAIGGFAGSGLLLTLSQGMARGCYSGDIGVGYASIIQAETASTDHQRQSETAIIGIFLDTFVICTLSVMLIVTTGLWHQDIPASLMIQTVLQQYFPGMQYFMPVFIFILGFSTLIAYLSVGMKCASFIAPKTGTRFYLLYACAAFVFFAFVEANTVLTVMSTIGALLLIINLSGVFKLRKDIQYQ